MMRLILTGLALLGGCMLLAACKHPLAVVGQGDIVDANGSAYGCTYEQYQAGSPACLDNEIAGDYYVNYYPRPHEGWEFVRWEAFCSDRSVPPYCLHEVQAFWIAFWPAFWAKQDVDAPVFPTTAIFRKREDAADRIRRYQPGDRIDFVGSATLAYPAGGRDTEVQSLSAQLAFFEHDADVDGHDVKGYSLTLNDVSETALFWQEADGTFHHLAGERPGGAFGRYVDTGTGTTGLKAFPSPMVANTSELYRYARIDSETEAVLATGTRTIRVLGPASVTVPMGTYTAYAIVIQEDFVDETAAGVTGSGTETTWISPHEGIIRVSYSVSWFEDGALQSVETVDISAVANNY